MYSLPLLFRYLNRVARHPILREDPDFRQFLEADVVCITNFFVLIFCNMRTCMYYALYVYVLCCVIFHAIHTVRCAYMCMPLGVLLYGWLSKWARWIKSWTVIAWLPGRSQWSLPIFAIARHIIKPIFALVFFNNSLYCYQSFFFVPLCNCCFHNHKYNTTSARCCWTQ